VQRLAPELFESPAPRVLLLPIGADYIVTRGLGLAGEQRDKFNCALAVVKRRNQRLDDADRAVVGASVTPGFEFVRLR
jgi:predicted cupin superfamily sugar epimerase